jgi:hypothetical protein
MRPTDTRRDTSSVVTALLRRPLLNSSPSPSACFTRPLHQCAECPCGSERSWRLHRATTRRRRASPSSPPSLSLLLPLSRGRQTTITWVSLSNRSPRRCSCPCLATPLPLHLTLSTSLPLPDAAGLAGVRLGGGARGLCLRRRPNERSHRSRIQPHQHREECHLTTAMLATPSNRRAPHSASPPHPLLPSASALPRDRRLVTVSSCVSITSCSTRMASTVRSRHRMGCGQRYLNQ